ncbi:DUF2752 domain-containing protein [Altibacter sp.]|uniref:DUF2752 domain-containing protein n=1 Tax=Altibacter sp. TaxID=2024823 RepID=UPI0025BE6934|nr:DUF2752 domain-containing protein [Altibacter sp.]
MIEGLEDYMLECTNKKIFGVECIGCGIQRATALLFKGEFIAAFKMYPAIYPLFILLLLVIFNFFVKFKYAFQIKVILLFITVAIMIGSYVVKMASVL